MPTYKQTGVNYKLKLIVNKGRIGTDWILFLKLTEVIVSYVLDLAFACITIIVWFGSGFLRTKKDQP